MSKGIELNGTIFAYDGSDIEHAEFLDDLMGFIVSRNWRFVGNSKVISNEATKEEPKHDA